MATEDTPLYFHDGDIIQLYCPLESGYVYSEPNSTSDMDLDIVTKENIIVADFAAFSICLERSSVLKKIVYGDVVYLKHEASDKFLVNKENKIKLSSDTKSSFRVVSSNHKLAWGKELNDENSIKLELSDNLFVKFDYDHHRNWHRPAIQADGTVFVVQMYCQCMKQDSKSIKGGTPIILSTLMRNIEAYVYATGSFVSTKIEKELKDPCAKQDEDFDYKLDYSKDHEPKGKVGLKEFQRGREPDYGNAFFQLEKVSKKPSGHGSQILFGEECRIKHLFTSKYISVTPDDEKKTTLCELTKKNDLDLIFKILPVFGSMDQREVCDCDKITFQHVKSSLHLSVNSQGQRNNRHFDFTLTEDDLELESQFKLLQLEKFYCYYAIGFSSFLCDSYIMLHYDDRNLVAIIKKEIKEKMTELEKLCKTKGFIRMLQCLTIFINEKETSHAKFGKTRLCIERKTTCVQNEEESTDTANDAEGDEADDAAIDLHIQKETYRASLEQPENMEWTLPVPIQEFFSNLPIADATTFLMKSDTIDDNRIEKIIMSCLKGYIDKNYVIDLENTGRGFAINATLVFRLLFLLHLLFIKYVYISTKERNTENNSPPSNNGSSRIFEQFFRSDFCRILSQLIASEDDKISYMSASLLFDIYMKEEIIDSWVNSLQSFEENDIANLRIKMWQSATMTDTYLLLRKMLANKIQVCDQLGGKCTEFLDEITSNCMLHESFKTEAHSCGLFHIALEYCVQHKVNSSKYRKTLLSKCFKLLQEIIACNRKVKNELFQHFYEFLQFKTVTDDMIILVNEIFYDNRDLCNKLTEADLGKIFNTAIIIENHQWTIVLQTIIEYTDSAVVQEYIAQLISENYSIIQGNVLKKIKKEGVSEDNWLMTIHNLKTQEYLLLLNITDLLASCASGECQYGRLVAMKLFSFNELIKILSNPSILSHRKIPYLRILTWTYLNKKIFTSSSAQYKSLWSHIVSTIKKFDKGREVISQDADRSNCIMYLQNINERMTKVMGLFYITYGVIPFLSQFVLSEHFEVELYGIKNTLLKFRDKWKCVSKQLSKFKCIEKIDLLLKKRNPNLIINPPCPSPADEAQNEEPLQLIEPNYEELMKHSIFTLHNIVSLLKSLINQQKIDPLPCLKRLDLEQTILRTLKTLIEQMKQSTKEKQHFDTSQTKIILFFGTDDATSTGNYKANLFDLLAEDQNIEIVIAVMKVLQCLNSDQNSVIKDEKEAKNIQTKIVDCCKEHDYTLIEKIHQLLGEAHFVINKAKRNRQNSTTDPLQDNVHFITAALDVICLLCDRQQKEMQDAMRNKGFIVSQVSFIFYYISKHCNNTEVYWDDMAQKTVWALIKMCTGNYDNQDIAFKGEVVVSINGILKMKLAKTSLKSSCLKLLEVMLEEIDENSWDLANRITSQLDINGLHKEMLNLWKLSFGPCKSIQGKSEDTLLLRSYHILMQIADYKETTINELVDIVKEMWDYCQLRTKSVEIVYKLSEEKETISRIYFPANFHIKGKNGIQSKIKRSTPEEKLFDLIEWANAVKRTHKQKHNLINNKDLCSLTLLHSSKWLLMILTILLNLFVLFTVNIPPDYNMSNDEACTVNETYNETCNNSTSSSPMYFQPIWSPDIPLWSTVILSILGFIHFILAVIMLMQYFYKNCKNLREFFSTKLLKCKNLREFSSTMIKYFYKSCKNLREFTSTKLLYSFLKIILGKYLSHQIYLRFSKYIKKPVVNDKHTLANEYYQRSWISFQTMYRIFFTICSFLAWIPVPGLRYFYCLCMLYPFLQLEVMSFISRAVKKSIKQLASVFLLCFIFIYIYAVISFAFLNNYFSEERDQFCGSLWQCFITVLHLGLLSTLGAELDIRPSDYPPDFKLYVFRTSYDLIFFIIVTTLGLSIITATLVDRFSEMRQKQDEVEKDNESRCFICNIERGRFNKDFKRHVKEEHNMWEYMYFIIYVNSLLEKDRSAMEKYVFEQVKANSIDFFPLYRAKSLPHYEHHESTTEKQSTQPQQAPDEHRRQGSVEVGSVYQTGHRRRKRQVHPI